MESSVPICLPPEEQKDPQLALMRLFEETDLEYIKIHLWHFLKAVFSEDYFRLTGQPVLVCDIVEHFKLIIDVFFLHFENERTQVTLESSVEDSEASDREYMLNVSNIYRLYNGHIRRLRKVEIENLYLVGESFFRFYTRNEWLEELKRWQYYALGNFSICEASDETRILEMYEHLEKLAEAAYLLHQRGTMKHNCAELENKNSLSEMKSSLGMHVFLTAEQQSEPFVYVCSYFAGTTLSQHTRELSQWIQAAFGKYVWDLHDPGRLVSFYEKTVRLIEAAFELYMKRESGVEWIAGATDYCKPMPEQSGYWIYPHYLDEKEAKDPWLVLGELFDHSLENYHKRLFNWLYQALKSSSIIDSDADLYFYNLLQKLAEALYILSVRVSRALEHETN
jgi:hypothetical protein